MSKKSGEDKPLLDKSVLEDLKLIMEDEFTEILQVFLEESVSLMSEIHYAFEDAPEDATGKVHALKSCGNNVGAIRLSEIAEEIRQHLIDNEITVAKDRLDELQDVFTQSHAQVKKYMKDYMDKVA
ncbi:MAG: Hpt domain-containing protein [Gammaproteobacteria bacterium]|jgi:HPt (histidine-containing phosphotransfer) domain-containing protein